VRSLTYQDLQTLCNVNHETQVAFLAVTGPRENEVVIGSGCYFVNPTTNLAEVAYMVAPDWQGQGVGKALQTRLQDYAMARGVRGFIFEVLPGNARMLRLAAGIKGVQTTSQDEDSMQVTTLFGAATPSKAADAPDGKPSKAKTKRPAKKASRK
jgi:GNAT superfamily N-acetyltransferase